jgi:hypothetical protein
LKDLRELRLWMVETPLGADGNFTAEPQRRREEEQKG